MHGTTMETYVFDDYIITENKYDPWLDSLITIKYKIYDLKTADFYIVPKNENVKVLQPRTEPVFGVWTVAGKVSVVIDTVNSTYQGFPCIIETSSTTTDTPLGSSDGKQIKYYADLSSVIPFKEKPILYFLGVREFKYDPHLFQVKVESQYDDVTITIMSMDIKRVSIDKARFDEVMAYIVK